MNLEIDSERGRSVAECLYKAFHEKGIHGKKDMPEDKLPMGVQERSLEHILFVTLTTCIDYMRDSQSLWNNSRKTYEDPQTSYLFEPSLVSETPIEKIIEDMNKHNLSQRPRQDAKIWRTNSITFHKKWNNNPINLFEKFSYDALEILRHLRNNRRDYPYLSADKIPLVWLRILKDNVGIKFKNIEKVPIPVDTHIARATLATGVVRGKATINKDELNELIKEAWFKSLDSLKINNRQIIPLDLDKPFWHLSRYGCSKYRDKSSGQCSRKETCEAKDFCVKGKIQKEKDIYDIDTWL
ncbi:hypothetical protein [Thermodesulfovibrio sp.]|uniref:hypothetical protein n=1 Tax=Thermodesulfovibrio sp. TaxID=2067987 RepID=UPI0030AFA326